MDFFFISNIDNKNYLSLVLRGRPYFNLKYVNYNVFFDCSETIKKEEEFSWDSYKKHYPKYVNSQLYFTVDNLYEVNICNWGFEILGEKHNLWCIKHQFLEFLPLTSDLSELMTIPVTKKEFLKQNIEQKIEFFWKKKSDKEFDKILNAFGSTEYNSCAKKIDIEEEL